VGVIKRVRVGEPWLILLLTVSTLLHASTAVGSMAVAAIGVIALPFAALPLMIVAMAIAGLGLGIGQPLTMSWVAVQAAPGVRATALSVRLMGNRPGQVVVPLAAGTVAAVAGTEGVLAVTGMSVAVSMLVVGGRAGGRSAAAGSFHGTDPGSERRGS
jgi:hypothetical protein